MARCGSVAAMVAYLDREETSRSRRKRIKRNLRRIRDERLRHFAQALVYEVEHDRECHEWNIREKVISRCKIGLRTYYWYLEILHKTLQNAPYIEAHVKTRPQQRARRARATADQQIM